MNIKLKKRLQAAFEAPLPTGKDHFLKQLRYPKITYQAFLFDQLHYIRKRVWIVSTLIILLSFCISFLSPGYQYSLPVDRKLWSICAALPFLAMITITEIYRSAAYRMTELEGSCRFCLTQIVMARMCILGVVNSFVLVLLLILIHRVSAYSLLQVIVYSMVPYLLVCAICLWLLKQIHGADGIYACAAATGLVSGLCTIFENAVKVFYSERYLNAWLMLFVCCLVLIGVQIRKLFKQLEEKQWNLNLIE